MGNSQTDSDGLRHVDGVVPPERSSEIVRVQDLNDLEPEAFCDGVGVLAHDAGGNVAIHVYELVGDLL